MTDATKQAVGRLNDKLLLNLEPRFALDIRTVLDALAAVTYEPVEEA